MNHLILLLCRLPLFASLRRAMSNSPCLTADEVIRFQEVDRNKRKQILFKSIDELIMHHDFSRSRLFVQIPAESKDLTVEVNNAYAAAGFDAKWLGNPDKQKEQAFPHVIALGFGGVTYDA